MMRMLEAVRAWWEPESARPRMPELPRAPRSPSALKVPLGEAEDGRSVEWEPAEGRGHLVVCGFGGSDGVLLALFSHFAAHREAWRVHLVSPDPLAFGGLEEHPAVEKAAADPAAAGRLLGELGMLVELRSGLLSREGVRDIGGLNEARAGRGGAPVPRVAALVDRAADLLEPGGGGLEVIARRGKDAGVHAVLAPRLMDAPALFAGAATLRMRRGLRAVAEGRAEYAGADGGRTELRCYQAEREDLREAADEEVG